MSLEAVFAPRRVALIGASDQPGKVGTLLWENLSSFSGEVIPITTSTDTVGGVKAYNRVGDVEGVVDLAVVSVPAEAVPGVAAEAREAGVGAIVVLSGGFAETGPDGAALQDRLAEAAGSTRIVGPNCFGVQNAALGLNASIAAGAGTDPGGISLITQSGAYGMAIHAMGQDEQVRFAKVYASGNKVDIDDSEVIRYLGDDPETTTICVFAESTGDGRALASAVASATSHTPVVIAKTGRSEAGGRAALSHTGALGTSDVVFRSVMDLSGAILVRSGLEMLDVARALDAQPLPSGRRVAIITNSGGTGVELVDLLASEGVDVPELSQSLQRRIAERLPAFASPRNPVDMTPVWSKFAELYPWLVDVLARSGEVDIVIPILLQRSATDRATTTAVRQAVSALADDGIDIPVYVCWVAPRSARSNADELQAGGVPCFEWPDRTARAVGHVVHHADRRSRVRAVLDMPESDIPALPEGSVAPMSAAHLLASHGIRLVETSICETADEAVEAADRFEGPVVMKTGDADIAHRTELGGVRLGVVGTEAVRDVFDELARLGCSVLVQRQVKGVEVAIGAVRDPNFGPVVMVGLGGIALELVGDCAFGLAPLTDADALALVESLDGLALLTGFRGSNPVDIDALVATIVGVGDVIAQHPEIAEMDLNPVMATPSGVMAVDWKITVANLPPPMKGTE